MTDYNLIFGGVLIFNVLVTFRASSYWTKYFPDKPVVDDSEKSDAKAPKNAEDPPDADDDDEPKPLLDDDKATDDVEKGETLELSSSSSAASDAAANIRHAHLLRKYLVVYLLAALSDWLQGPYVYALYDAYGYSQHDIAVLFVAGFGSSMVFGSFVGGMADQ